MERVAQGTNGEVWFDQLTAGQEVRSPFVDQPFLILILNVDRALERSRIDEISASLVRERCRYAVCAGFECEAWHDATDLEAIGPDPPRTAKEVQTTWLSDEPLAETVEFFLHLAYFDGSEGNYLVLLVGADSQAKGELLALVRALFA
ncbi:MAG: hypothetical protein M3Z11_05165 [Candidatus Dormibacteraeota bacterium]|nr:hypothetical protein [Candidatus Dormibacteraeota bacterium]